MLPVCSRHKGGAELETPHRWIDGKFRWNDRIDESARLVHNRITLRTDLNLARSGTPLGCRTGRCFSCSEFSRYVRQTDLNNLSTPFFLAGLLALFGWFLVGFWFPGQRLKKLLKPILNGLAKLRKGDLEGVRALLTKELVLQHFWSEYEETLHKQFEINLTNGERRCAGIRATVPAEAFFNPQNVIEGRLKSELFKHFPGIFTGIGIIGTFFGLISGLKAFRVTDDANVVRQSLEGLLHLVSDAFLVSAAAIALAMVLTFIEKLQIESLSALLRKICHEIDRQFVTGVTEEYLERLVKASEESATQARILKDSLVGDLKQILEEVTERQIIATTGGPAQIGKHFQDAIQSNLAEPLSQIAEGLRRDQQSSGEVLTAALGDVLLSFSQKLEDMFGGQVNGIAEVQQETIKSLTNAVAQLERMAGNLDRAGQEATDRMAARLIESLDTMSERQRNMNEEMGAFVSSVQRTLAESQSEGADRLRRILSELGGQMAGMVAELRDQAQTASETHRSQQDRLTQTTGTALQVLSSEISQSLSTMTAQLKQVVADSAGHAERRAAEGDQRQQQILDQTDMSLSTLRAELEGTVSRSAAENQRLIASVESMLKQNQSAFQSAIKSMEIMLAALNDSGAKSAERLSSGVSKLATASSDFAKAGQGVNQALQEATGLAQGLGEFSRVLDKSSGTLTKVIEEHQKSRKSLTEMVEALELVVASARKEASLTEDALKTINGSAEKLSRAHKDVEDYLDEVSTGLITVNEEFTSGLRSSIQVANLEFHKHLTTAVGALREGIEELEVTIGRIPANGTGKK